MNTPKLPPLPEPASVYRHPDDEWTIDAYTPEDMNAHYLKGYNDALAAIQAQGVPVAWKWKNKKTAREGVYAEDPREVGVNMLHPDYEWTPLYTNPAPQQKPLTDEQIDNLYINGTKHWIGKREIARAIESAATEPLLQRIEELEQRNSDLHEDVQRFKKHALNEKAARLELERKSDQDDETIIWQAKEISDKTDKLKELERQLEEARKDAERWRTFLSTRPKATHDVINQAIDDAAMQKGQS